MRELGQAYPSITAIRVKDVLETFNAVFAKVMTAVRAAGSVTLLAGALVLAGALATAQRRRILEAVILKTLGATRRRILASHFLEYLLLVGGDGAVRRGTRHAGRRHRRDADHEYRLHLLGRRRGAGAGAVDGAGVHLRRRRHLGGAEGARRALPALRVNAW